MPRPDRFEHIRIGGEPVAIVDYGQLFLRLAYAEAGVKPPRAIFTTSPARTLPAPIGNGCVMLARSW